MAGNQELIKSLGERRAAAVKRRDDAAEAVRAVTETAKTEQRSDLTEAETATVTEQRAAHAAAVTEERELSERITELADQDERDAKAGEIVRRYETGFGAGVGGATTNEPEVYSRSGAGQRDADGKPYSYFIDLAAAARGSYGARERLERCAKQRDAAVKRMSAAELEKRAISTTTGAGGEFVPPLWLEDDWIPFLRPGRIIADKTTKNPLPAGTNQIFVPKVNSGTAVAQQGTQNTPIQQTDLTTTSISSPVLTLAGGQTIAMQLIEQSPLNIDQMILRDLAADYGMKLDAALIAALLTAGNAVAWTQASPAFSGAGGFYNTFLKAVMTLETTRFAAPTAVFMHPRRWAWILSSTDGNQRPLVVPHAGGPMNAFGSAEDPAAQGYVGTLGGLPVYVDPGIPTNLGAGTNQDPIVVAKIEDVLLWEGSIRTEAFNQTYANQLSLFVRLYNYVSVQAGKYPASLQVVNGTGSVTPTF